MRKFALYFCFLIFVFVFAPNGHAQEENVPKVGEVLVIKEPSRQNYQHIDFPNLNIIVKRSGLPNYKSVYGKRVVIKEVLTKKDGKVHVILEPQSGKKFFGYLKSVNANYAQAIASGEMSIL